MSRSTKKPFYTDQNRGKPQRKRAKKWAHKAERTAKEVANGSGYKKEYNSWDIRDWSFRCPDDKKAYRK